jgi:transcriptional regulator with XRE-family HTH domain
MAKIHLGYFSPKELGNAIRAERKALGRTQQWVADKCHIRTATVSDIETGKNVELFTVLAVLNALGKGLQIVDRNIDLDRLEDIFGEED